MKKYVHIYLILIISSCFYCFTLAPTIIGGDSASFCVSVHKLALHFGRAWDHPLHTVLGKLFSFLPFELAFNLNLMSAFFGVQTVLLIFLIIQHLTHSHSTAFFGSLSLMVSHAFWQHSVITEVYTLHAFFVALLVYLAVTMLRSKWFKYLFPMVFVLGLLNHLILLLTLPAFLVYIVMNIEPRQRKMILKASAIVLSFMIFIVICLFIFQSRVMKDLLIAILKGPPPILHYILPPDLTLFMKELVFYGLYLCYQYPLLGAIIGVIGIVQLLKKDRPTAVLLLLIIVSNGLFFIKTTSWGSYGGTKYTFYISDYTVFAVFVGYGALSLFKQISYGVERWQIQGNRRKIQQQFSSGMIAISVILTVIFYALMPLFVSYLNIDLLHARTLPYRDNNTFFLNPNKRGYYGDRKFGEEILELSQENAVVFADFTPHSILRYLMKIEHNRPDVKLFRCDEKTDLSKRIDTIKRERPHTHIYLADNNEYYNLEAVEETFRIKPYASFFEIIAK